MTADNQNREPLIFRIAAVEALLDLPSVHQAKAATKSLKNKEKQLIVTLAILSTTAKVWQA